MLHHTLPQKFYKQQRAYFQSKKTWFQITKITKFKYHFYVSAYKQVVEDVLVVNGLSFFSDLQKYPTRFHTDFQVIVFL